MKAYDIKIRLDKVKPLCWRDLIIPSGINFDDLTNIAQTVYGFEYNHDYEFIFKDMDLVIEGLEDGVPLHFIRELDDYYLSMTYNLGEEFEIDYFFDNYKKIKLQIHTRDNWPMTIEVKKVVESDVSYPIVKRFKGDYNPLEYSCDRGDFIDFLYLQEHPEEKDDEYFSKAVDYWDDFQKFDLDKTQEILKKTYENYFNTDLVEEDNQKDDDDSINILPNGPTTIVNINSELYDAKLIGENSYGSVYLHEEFLDNNKGKKVAFITGLNPIESKAYRAVHEAIDSPLDINFTTFYQYHINYDKSVDEKNQSEVGKNLIEEFIIPDILDNDYELVIDVHSQIEECIEDRPTDFIFGVNEDKTREYMDEISSVMLQEYKPPEYEAPEHIKSLTDANQKVLYFETYSYEALSITYTICSNLMKAIDKKVYENRVNSRRK